MKQLLIALIGLIGAYLICVGNYNAWNFITGLEPVEVVKRLATFAYLSFMLAYITWMISKLLTE